MSTGVITSFTLIDFPSESEMTAFFVFFENNIEALAKELRANGMKKTLCDAGFQQRGEIHCRQLAGIQRRGILQGL